MAIVAVGGYDVKLYRLEQFMAEANQLTLLFFANRVAAVKPANCTQQKRK